MRKQVPRQRREERGEGEEPQREAGVFGLHGVAEGSRGGLAWAGVVSRRWTSLCCEELNPHLSFSIPGAEARAGYPESAQ